MTTLPVGAVSNLYAEAKTLGADGPGTVTHDVGPVGSGFMDAMETAASRAVDTIGEAERLSMAAAKGQASTKDVVQAVVAAEMTVQSIVTVRNKLVESYQEIMRMPI